MSDINAETFAPNAAFDRTVAQLKQGVTTATAAQAEIAEKAVKGAKDMAAFGQGSMEAFTQAAQIYATGSQALFRQFAESTQTAMSEAFSGMRALASTTSLKERMELQATLVRTSAAWMVSESNRIATANLELAEKVAAPIAARAAIAAETFATIK